MPELGFAISHAWLVPALPLFGFAVIGLIIRPMSKQAAGIAATAVVGTAAALAYAIAWEYLHLFEGEEGFKPLVPWTVEWLRYEEHLVVNIGVLVDPISVVLMVVVTTVSALVHLYSIGYMHGETGYGRYFTYLNLFTFSMLGLVVAPNILQMYVCWELVGVSSFLLIGYYYDRPAAVSASKKAFIVTRFADLGFLVGVLVLGYWGFNLFDEVAPSVTAAGALPIQPFDFLYLNSPAFLTEMHGLQAGFLGMSVLTTAMLLVFMGAAGKSAMFPLHIWLPDAMEGPTPVSALIHAATMVVAGVYLVARLFPAFAASGDALYVVAYVGGFTSLFAAVIAITQDDIKRVLAFSTLSQLGYMMMALGVSSMETPLGYTASMFHLFTHAFFKALLFLGAGSVIHAVHSNDIWKMGGLSRKMPVTHLTFLVATLAIAGIWPFAGFFSKDEILASALHAHFYLLFVVALFVAGLTAFYMFRIYFLTFWGEHRDHGAEHAHESPFTMKAPLIILAVLSLVAGFAPFPEWVHMGEHHGEHGIDFAIAIPATLAALAGIALSWYFYTGPAERIEGLTLRVGRAYGIVKQKFFIDEFYLFVTKRIIFHLIARPIAWFDRHVVDGGVNLTGWITRTMGFGASFLQTGEVQTYGLWFASGGIFLLMLLWAAQI